MYSHVADFPLSVAGNIWIMYPESWLITGVYACLGLINWDNSENLSECFHPASINCNTYVFSIWKATCFCSSLYVWISDVKFRVSLQIWNIEKTELNVQWTQTALYLDYSTCNHTTSGSQTELNVLYSTEETLKRYDTHAVQWSGEQHPKQSWMSCTLLNASV